MRTGRRENGRTLPAPLTARLCGVEIQTPPVQRNTPAECDSARAIWCQLRSRRTTWQRRVRSVRTPPDTARQEDNDYSTGIQTGSCTGGAESITGKSRSWSARLFRISKLANALFHRVRGRAERCASCARRSRNPRVPELGQEHRLHPSEDNNDRRDSILQLMAPVRIIIATLHNTIGLQVHVNYSWTHSPSDKRTNAGPSWTTVPNSVRV